MTTWRRRAAKLLRRHASLRHSAEQGSALVIALVMIAIVALLAGAVLQYTDTSLKATGSVTSDRNSLYAADGALETAIRQIGSNPASGYSDTCPGPNTPLIQAAINGKTAAVGCADPQPPTTSQHGDGGINSDAPRNAILTTGQRANEPPTTHASDQCGIFWWTRPDRNDEVVEPGVYFSPSPNAVDLLAALFNNPPCGYTSFKQSQNVSVAGGVISNSTVVGKADQSLNVSGPIKVRQACAFTGNGTIVSSTGSGVNAACDVKGYVSTDADFTDPGYPSRAQLPSSTDASGNAVSGLPPKPVYPDNVVNGVAQNVPACGTSTLVMLVPGWYDNAEALNTLFRTCSNADGSGKDFWFMPGVYYFDFRNTSVTQGCGNAGVDADPGAFGFGQESDTTPYVHQLCLRGQNISDGSTTNQKRPHIVAGTPLGWNPQPNPVTSLLKAATAASASGDFTNPDNAKDIDGSSATASWSGATSNQTLGTAASSQLVSGTDDFANRNNATGAMNGTVASAALASVAQAITAATATSTQLVPGTDDFANKANATGAINGTLATANVASASQSQTLGTAASSQLVSGTDDFANKNNATGAINGTVASAALASVAQAITAATATSTQLVPGTDDFANRTNATGAINGTLATASLTSPPTSLVPTGSATSQVTSGADFGSIGNARVIDGSVSSHTLASGSSTMVPTSATSSQTVPGTDDFSNATAGEAIGGSTATATVGTVTTTLTPASSNQSPFGSNQPFTNPTRAYAIEGNANSGNVATFGSSGSSGSAGTYGQIILSGYPGIPATATPTSASITLAHVESSTSNIGTMKVAVLPPTGTIPLCTVDMSSFKDTNYSQDSANLPAGCLANAANVNGVRLSYEVQRSSGTSSTRTFSLDGISLTVTYNNVGTESLALGSLSPQVADPANTAIDAASLTIRHSESAAAGQQLVLTPGVGAPCAPINLSAGTSLHNDVIDVKASGCLDTAAKLNGATLTYQATTGSPVTVNVDGASIAVTATDIAARFVTLSSLSPNVGPGVTVDSAALFIAHRETGNNASPRVVITPGGGSPCAPIALTTRSSLTTDQVDVKSCLSTPAKVNGATIQYLVNLADNGTSQSATVSLDGAHVDVVSTDTTNRGITLSNTSPTVVGSTTVDTASLTVAHAETLANTSPRVVVTPGDGSGACAAFALPTHAAVTSDALDVKSCLSTPAKVNGATFQYLVNMTDTGASQTGTASLDAMSLSVLTTNPANRTLTLSAPAPSVPTAAGTTLDSASVTIQHQETGNAVNPRLVVTPGGGSPCAMIPLTSRAALGPDTVDVKASGCLDTPTKINGATYQYVVNLTDNGASQNATANVDAVRVDVLTTNAVSRGLTLSNLSATVPTATVDSATLTVAHQETGSALNPRVLVTPGTGAACTVPLTPRAALTSDPIDVKASGCLDTPAKLNGAAFQYLVNLTDTGTSQNATASLDALRLDVLSTNTTARALTLSTPSPAVPTASGTTVTSAMLSIAHQETGGGVNPQLVVTPGGGGTCTIPLTARAALGTDTFDVLGSGCLDTPVKLNGATYKYQVGMTDTGASQSAVASIDAVTLTVVTANGSSKSLTLSNFATAIPTGSTGVTGVTLNVAHGETPGSTVQITVTPGGGGTCSLSLPVHSALATDQVSLTSCLRSPTQVNGASVVFTVSPPGGTNASSTLDGMTLSVIYRPPPDRAPVLGNNNTNGQESVPGCDETKPGVQWIFGGDSHVYQPDATVELCAGPAAGQAGQPGYTKQQIVVYGVAPTPPMVPTGFDDPANAYTAKTNAYTIGEAPQLAAATLAGSGPATLTPAATATSSKTAGLNDWSNPNNALDISSGTVASFTSSSGKPTANLTLGGYPTIPGSAAPTSATVTVKSFENSTSGSPSASLAVLDSTGTQLCTQSLNTSSSSSNSQTVTLPSTCLNTAAKVNGVQLKFTGTRNGVTTFNLGGMSLGITYSNNGALTLKGFTPTTVPAGMTIGNVTARVSHQETGSSFSGGQAPTVSFTNGLGQSCGAAKTLSIYQNSGFSFFSRDQNGPVAEPVDLTSCFTSAGQLSGPGTTATFGGTANAGQQENLDGIELDVTFAPADPSTPVVMPESGCITAQPKYDQGYGSPDCALWKWDSAEYQRKVFGFGWDTITGRPNGQASFRGTIYAPGAAIDVDDQGARTQTSDPNCNTASGTSVGSACYAGVNYPIFERGLIARHLRFKAFKLAPSYTKAIARCQDAACAGGFQDVPNPKLVTLTAKVDGTTRITATVCFGPVAGGTCTYDSTDQKPRVMTWNIT